MNSDAVKTCSRKDCDFETVETKTTVLQLREVSENEFIDDENAETSKMGDMSYSNQSCLNQLTFHNHRVKSPHP